MIDQIIGIVCVLGVAMRADGKVNVTVQIIMDQTPEPIKRFRFVTGENLAVFLVRLDVSIHEVNSGCLALQVSSQCKR